MTVQLRLARDLREGDVILESDDHPMLLIKRLSRANARRPWPKFLCLYTWQRDDERPWEWQARMSDEIRVVTGPAALVESAAKKRQAALELIAERKRLPAKLRDALYADPIGQWLVR